MRLLAGHFGIDKIIKHPPDVVLTVRDAAKASYGLAGAPGSLRVVDEKTIYFRPPPTYLEPDTLLMVMRNLLRQLTTARSEANLPLRRRLSRRKSSKPARAV